MFGSLLPTKPQEGEEDIEETDSAAPTKDGDKEGEARDYMADILLAKNKLSSLQKQVSSELSSCQNRLVAGSPACRNRLVVNYPAARTG